MIYRVLFSVFLLIGNINDKVNDNCYNVELCSNSSIYMPEMWMGMNISYFNCANILTGILSHSKWNINLKFIKSLMSEDDY